VSGSSLLVQSLARHAAERPEAIAFEEIATGRRLTWSQLLAACAHCSSQLREFPGGPIALSSPTQLEYLVAFHAALLADRVIAPLSPHLTPAEVSATLETIEAGAIIGPDAVLGQVTQPIVKLPLGSVPLSGDVSEVASALGKHRATGSLLLQTSGTTGLPKIIRRDSAEMDAVADNCRHAIGFTEHDRMLAVIPLYHAYGIDHCVTGCIIAGCTVELQQGFDPARVLASLAGDITLFPGVPFMHDVLSQMGGEPSRLPKLRHVYSAGSPLPLSVYEAFVRRFGVKIGQLYGTTEFASCTFADVYAEGFDPASVGRPMRGVVARIVDPLEPRLDRPLAPGVEGHLAIAAPSMFAEYVGPAGEPVRDGFFLTGDLARLDERGNITVTGRLKLLIDIGGLKVNPMEVEQVLTSHEQVKEAVVVATPVTETVNRLKAIIVPHAGGSVDIDDLRRLARQRLSPHKVPRQFEVRTSLPRSPTGKILRKALQC
jgi:long-chain acyl-CoA synthetase